MILIALAAAALASAAPTCPTDDTAAGLLCHAVEASDASKFAEAAALFERAAAAAAVNDPRTQRMLAAAGNMWIAANQPGKAAIALDKALAGTGLQAEQRGLALLDRARAAEAQNDLKAARRFASDAGATISSDPFYWYFSAALAVRENDLTTAKSAIGKALTLGPTLPEILFEAGYIAHATGNDIAARDYWQRAIYADPTGPIGASAKRQLDALGGALDAPSAATPTGAAAKPR